jgi:hypothetical protein
VGGCTGWVKCGVDGAVSDSVVAVLVPLERAGFGGHFGPNKSRNHS